MNAGAPNPTVTHRPQQRCFETTVDGERCHLDYSLADAVMTIVHTFVPVALEGRGIAAALMRAALQSAREQGWKVYPQCSYAVAFLRKHPELAS